MSEDLTQFLRARLDEDKAAAMTAKPGPWHDDGGSVYATHPTDEVVIYTEDSAAHIARHDPARVLREVEAKRAILSIHGPITNGWGGDRWQGACGGCGGEYDDPITPKRVDCPHLRLMAAVYADHPDYRQEWKP